MGASSSLFASGGPEYVRAEKRVAAKNQDPRRSNSLKDFAQAWVHSKTFEEQMVAMDGVRKYWKRYESEMEDKADAGGDPVLDKMLRTPALVQGGDVRRLREAVTMKWRDINRVFAPRPFMGDTLLHLVCREGYLSMLQFMLAPTSHTLFETVQLNANVTNKRGRTPLHLCFTPPHFTYTARLGGLTLDAATGLARPAAEPPPGAVLGQDWIAPGGEEERRQMVALLVGEGGADPKAQDFLGFAAVHYAALWGWSDTLKVLARARADMLQTNAAGETCLHIAALNGHAAAVKTILSLAPRLKDRTEVTGRRPVHCALAAASGSEDVLKQLAAVGADFNAADYDGLTPFKMACQANSAPLVLALLDGGAEPAEDCVALLEGQAAERVKTRLRKDADDKKRRLREAEGAEWDEKRRREEAARGKWKPYKDKVTGKFFYYNTVSRVSQWQVPPDYVADPDHLVKSAMFGLHFYH